MASPLARGQERLLPIQLGRVFFFPSVTLSQGREDNVQRLSEGDPFIGPIESDIRDIQPLLRFEFPFQKNLLRLVYRGDFRTYSAEMLRDVGGMSQFVDFSGHFEAARRLRVDVAEHYVDSITALLSTAPGGQFQYGTQPLKSESTRLAVSFDLGPTQSVEVGALRGDTRFEKSATSAFFFDYAEQNLFFRYVVDSGPQDQIYASVDVQDVEQGNADLVLQPGRYQTRSLGAGFRRVTGRDLTSEIRVAYTSTDFREGLWAPFRGITLEADVNLAPSPRTQAQIRLRRSPLVSFFNVSAYYLDEAMEVDYSRALGRALGLRLSAGYQRNSYANPIQVSLDSPGGELDRDSDGLIDAYENLLPSEGDSRHDRLTTASLTIVWHASRAMDLTLGYRRQQSRSSVEAQGIDSHYHIYDYDSHGLVLAAVLGWQ